MNFFLATYAVRIFENIDPDYKDVDENRRRMPRDISNFNSDGDSDIYLITKKYIERLSEDPIVDENRKTVFKLLEYKIYEDRRLLTGTIEAGYYGLSGSLIDSETGSSRPKKSTEASAMPYFFAVYLPRESNEGILILEMIGNHGIKTIIERHFRRAFRADYGDYRTEINALVPEQIVKQIITEGIVKRLRFIRFKSHTDPTDLLKDFNFEEPVGAEFVIYGNYLNVKDQLLSVFNPGSKVNTLIELKDSNFKYDTIKAELTIGGNRKRTIDMSDILKSKAVTEITDKLDFVDGNHPDFDSIQRVAIQHLEKTKKLMGYLV